MTTEKHEPDVEKAFRRFFNEWVAVEAQAGGNALRHAVRDSALDRIRSLIERAQNDRFYMQALERDE